MVGRGHECPVHALGVVENVGRRLRTGMNRHAECFFSGPVFRGGGHLSASEPSLAAAQLGRMMDFWRWLRGEM